MEFQMNELAKRTELSKDTIRYYIKISLLKPKRDPANRYNLFNEKDFLRLRFICKAKYLGFTLKEIKQIIRECEEGHNPCPMVREFLQRHIEEHNEYIKEHIKIQERMETAWKKWQEIPDSKTKFEEYCALIDSVVSAEAAINNNNVSTFNYSKKY